MNLDALPAARFETVFALDSLEHNDDVPGIINLLLKSMTKRGLLILSGPTENLLYRLGRWLAGFDGHYHKTNIHHIESVLRLGASPIKRSKIPLGLPLFYISAWHKK